MRKLSLTTAVLMTALCFCAEYGYSGSRPKVVRTSAAKPGDDAYTRDIKPLLVKYCYECHGNGKKKAGLSLEKFQSDESMQTDRKTWDNVLHMVRTREMPPKEKPQPTAAESETLLKSIDFVLASFDCTKFKNAGRVTLHRLNKVEYNNTIRDLVGIDFKPAADFPDDDVGYGFDNIGDVLTLSPLLMERYMAAAESILDRAIIVIDAPKAAKKRLIVRSFPEESTDEGKGYKFLYPTAQIWGESNFKEGDYNIRVEVARSNDAQTPVGSIRLSDQPTIKEFEVKEQDWTKVEVKVHVKAGTHRVEIRMAKLTESTNLLVKSIQIDGPYNPPQPPLPQHTQKLLEHKAGQAPREAAREIITRFATKAFRHPVSATDLERFMGLYDKANDDGLRFELSVRRAMYGMLVSPSFLFRVELDPADAKTGDTYLIDEFNLASRLSYFLWRTMPDEALFKLAEKGELRKNLDAQVKRMMADPKSLAFIDDFASQWLTLRNMPNLSPDPKYFPQFDEELRKAMYRETELFFETMVRDDHNIFDLLDAKFTFVNERLAKHYGIEGIEGDDFRKVNVPEGRCGILTQASILTLTSNPNRTSPVKRGKWVLEQIFNAPPPPPPPDVPLLEEQKQLTGSLRKVMEMHRAAPGCAACHQKMDPLGFAFENFDAIGSYRTKDGEFPVDSSGVLPDGKTFKGPIELITLLKDKKDLFGRCLSEKMLTYALGRGLEYYDKCAVDKMIEALKKNDYKFSTLLVEIVNSEPFQLRTASGVKK